MKTRKPGSGPVRPPKRKIENRKPAENAGPFVDQKKALEDFLADVPPAVKVPDMRPPMKRDALEEGYHALEAARIEHGRAIRELSGDMGRIAVLLAQYLPSERREDFKREAADILNRKQEQS